MLARPRDNVAVLVDDFGAVWRGKPRYHLAADSVEELHRFAASLGIARCWFHRGARVPHYDITATQRARALAAGAIGLTSRELVLHFRNRQMALCLPSGANI